MEKSILDLVIPDAHFILVAGDLMRVREEGLATTERYKDGFNPQMVQAIKDAGMEEDIPDYIRVDHYQHQVNGHSQYHTGNDKPSLQTVGMQMQWAAPRKGPSRVQVSRLKKWHHEGVIHRRRANALICKTMRFEWVRDATYYRESGPFMITLKNVQMFFNMGQMTQFTMEKLGYRWAIEGRELSQQFVEAVINQHGFKLDLLHPVSVFRDDVQEFEFYTELGARFDTTGGF